MSRSLFVALALVAGSSLASAQQIISAKAGLIQVAEGDVRANGKSVEVKATRFPSLQEGEVLETGDGRAEVLLVPSSYLRVSSDSAFKLVSSDLEDVQVEAIKGTLSVEYGEFSDINAITMKAAGRTLRFTQAGNYYIDLEAGELKVYAGEVTVTDVNPPLKIKDGRMLNLRETAANPVKFDKELTTAFYRWSKSRAFVAARANESLALSSARGGTGLIPGGMYGWNALAGRWWLDPYTGLFTYIPLRNGFYSPFGFAYYRPDALFRAAMNQVYAPSPALTQGTPGAYDSSRGMGGVYNSGGWASGRGSSSAGSYGGYSGSGASSSAPVSSPSSGGVRSGGSGSAGGSGGGSGRGQ